ncbi:delta-aminolevulinic acid dehydratase [Luminiphilus syltensis]|uniref:delta-aminolevulinic acid dehydratase n=1 Tax=Luminiphilus syltensis TaxID=1341119 RepID=UPI0002DB96FE|nr:delta-aminolevulinic acid dehydratase [Luminiphilus syltensis]
MGKAAMTRQALLVALLTGFTNVSLADPGDCSCLWQGSFAEVAKNTDAVVLGEVVATRGNAVDLKIESTLHGLAYPNPIRVWMKTGSYCRPEVERFPEESRWVMALFRIEADAAENFDPATPNQSYGRPFDYRLSGCGGYHLRVNGDTVKGNLVPGMTRWDQEPEMTPVLLEVVTAFLKGRASSEDLKSASEEDPALKALMLDTRTFLRGQSDYLDDDAVMEDEETVGQKDSAAP